MRARKATGIAVVLAMILVGSPSHAADRDGDGLDDVWELRHFGSLAAQDGAGDADGDGLSNLLEQTAGSDPNRAGSFSPVDSIHFWMIC